MSQQVTLFPGWHLLAYLFSWYSVLLNFSSSVYLCALIFIEGVAYSSVKTVPQVFHQIAANLSPFKALQVFERSDVLWREKTAAYWK